LTHPNAETESIGLQADARGAMVFTLPSGQFYLDTKRSFTYRYFALARKTSNSKYTSYLQR